jgi:HEAT repeat protein
MVIWPDGEWEAWLFANWLPGAMRFRSFAEWMRFAQAEFLAERFEHQSADHEMPTVYRDPPNTPIRRIRPGPKTYTLPQLLKGLASSDEWVRKRAVKRMGTVRTKEAMNLLIASMKSDPSGYVQWEAAESLGRLGFTEAVDALIEASQDLAQNNSSAIAALARIKDERGLQHLLEVVREGGMHAGVAAHQLVERGDLRVIDASKHVLSAVTPAVNDLADSYAETIAQFGTKEVLDVLALLIGHPEARVRMRGVRGIAMLSASAKDKSIKAKAIMALRELAATEANPEVRQQLEFELSWVTGHKALTITPSSFE